MKRRRFQLATLVSLPLALAGCGQTPPTPTPVVSKPPAVAKPTPPPTPVPTVAVPAPEPAPPPKPKPVLAIGPESATIRPGDDGVQLVARIDGDHGGRLDLTRLVTWEVEPAGVVAIDADGYARPVGPGKATVRATRGDDLAEATVEVVDADRAWDFAADIVPILTRLGCNTGGCHGRADGQNGFHLSLFGYDPAGDHVAITRQAGARRVEPFAPESSLLIQKATGRNPHGGGQRITPGSESYNVLLGWIKAGAPERSGETHGTVVKVAVEPAEFRLDEPGPLQVHVVAHFADGHTRDVTRLANFKTRDDGALVVDEQGHAELLRRAEADLVVRFQSSVVSARLAAVVNPDLATDFAKLPRANFVDDELYKRLASLKVPPSPAADDAAFLRRATLDLTAQQPDPQAIRDYIKDNDPDKRAKLVDRLIDSRDFLDFWQIKLGDLLQINRNKFNSGTGAYLYWLNHSLIENTPWDQMVRELLTSLGDPTVLREGGPANYALDGPDAKVKAELTAQRFLGLRIRCAQCHDHPFDVWTQDDYFGLAAFFAKTGVGGPTDGAMMMNRPVVRVDPNGSVEHLRTKQAAEPRLPGGESVVIPDGEDPRKALADWITRPDNPYFARAMANWVWAQFFGKGIADPADDLSAANPPVHPELLDALARHFVEHKYDLRDLIRTVATSNAYAASSATVPGNERDTRLFSHHLPRPLTAYQMADALAAITNVPNRFGQLGVRKAIEINDPTVPSALLDAFGRCPRTSGCATAATPNLSLRQALLLIGGGEVDSKVSSINGYLAGLMELEMPPADVVENLYLRALCRPPTDAEKAHWVGVLKESSSAHEAAEDLFWALLNSREFAFNH